ncbi:hypothetical protein HanXRQr2_Chr14g0639411 [Helianthus annuus]|uniref:Transmembrane protein n=1 Tax=Helianthus annuus TaxID=4232 RepID=A0A9K3H7B3_HELAN|nr:hypothetical protein HanXRQr2_Chr14g0639411 [Helianthus annuus]KAJ0468197.1 hypothetical protein HanIR_Chr14g0693891 [Helianthus annuus]KAJ0839971.1 hypothetical protein HanPSC8_Chr14g0613181 [Helianthus annuus]
MMSKVFRNQKHCSDTITTVYLMRIGGVRGSKNHLPITNGESVIRFGLAVNPNCRFIVSILFWWFLVVVVDDRRHMWDVVVMVDTLRWWWWWTVVICRVGSRGARWWGVELNVGWRWVGWFMVVVDGMRRWRGVVWWWWVRWFVVVVVVVTVWVHFVNTLKLEFNIYLSVTRKSM